MEDFTVEKIREAIGRDILKHRKKLKLSQRALASNSGITQAQVGRLEKGSSNYTIDTLISVYKSIGFDLSRIIRP